MLKKKRSVAVARRNLGLIPRVSEGANPLKEAGRMISLPPRSRGESRLVDKRGVIPEDPLLSGSGKDLR